MGLCIHYRSCDTMHPASAFQIFEHAEQLGERYLWRRCEPVRLEQKTDGFLIGDSRPCFEDTEEDELQISNLCDGNLLTMIEVLRQLSAHHDVDWIVSDEYGPEYGRICDGLADPELIEQMLTLESIGDLLQQDDGFELPDDRYPDGRFPENPAPIGGDSANTIDANTEPEDDESDDEGPRLLKFPDSR